VAARTSSPFALRVAAAVHSAIDANGQVPSHVTAYSPVTHLTYHLTCTVEDGPTAVCSTRSGGHVLIALEGKTRRR
jgi:hypothetical protein